MFNIYILNFFRSSQIRCSGGLVDEEWNFSISKGQFLKLLL